jgi:hypothetical protein
MTAPEAASAEPAGQDSEQEDSEAQELLAQASQEEPGDKKSVWDDPESARKEGERARKEAAKYRTRVRELEPLALKWTEKVNSEKSEADLLREKVAELEAAHQEASLRATRQQIAADTGMPPDLIPLLNGSEEEMRETASELATKYGSKPAHVVSHGRPTPVLRTGQAAVDEAPTMDDLIRSLGRR